MKRIVPFRHPEPLAAMNMTPFIDVLLVLLVMLIITIPLQSHKIGVDLPGQRTDKPRDPTPHTLAMDPAGLVYWDGQKVADAQLPALLAQVAQNDTALQMQIDPETRYERFDQVLAIVKANGVTQLGFVGHEKMSF